MDGYDGIVVTMSILLAGFAAALFAPPLLSALTGMRRTIRIRSKFTREENNRFGTSLLADLATNGFTPCRLPARYAMKVSLFSQLVENTQTALQGTIPGCTNRGIAELLCAVATLSGVLAYLLTGQVMCGLAGLVLPLVGIRFKVNVWLRKRNSLLREQLPDALRGLGMCFMAGLSLEQAFDQTVLECREPLRRELRRTVDDLHTGSSVRESLSALDARLSMDEIRFVSVALEIQHRTGGSMREVLDSAADSLLASFDLSRSLEVQTAQARMSARIVSTLPLALVLVLSLTMEGYLATFFSSPAGFALLVCALALQVAGILFIRKILGVDLG